MSSNEIEIGEFICKYTVQILLVNDKDYHVRQYRNGSGILLQLNGVFIIITAGHCIAEWEKNTDKKHIVIANNSKVSLKVVSYSFRYVENKEDYGFLRLDSIDANKAENLKKAFLPTTLISVSCPLKGDRVIVSGYPESLNSRKSEKCPIVATRHVHVQGVTGYITSSQSFKAWVSSENIENTFLSQEGTGNASSSGMSGGGCWLSNIKEDWQPDAMRLCGIHYRAGYVTGGRYMHEMPVSNHLRLIFENVPELRDSIRNEWPDLFPCCNTAD